MCVAEHLLKRREVGAVQPLGAARVKQLQAGRRVHHQRQQAGVPVRPTRFLRSLVVYPVITP
jgi:hypothetical protein